MEKNLTPFDGFRIFFEYSYLFCSKVLQWMWIFLDFNPCFDSSNVIDTFVLPQFEQPAIMQQIEFGNESLCRFCFIFRFDVNSLTLRTRMLIECLANLILPYNRHKTKNANIFKSVLFWKFNSKHAKWKSIAVSKKLKMEKNGVKKESFEAMLWQIQSIKN